MDTKPLPGTSAATSQSHRAPAVANAEGRLHSLGPLADPQLFHQPLDINGCDTELLIKQLRDMLIIRLAEEQIGDMVTAGKVHCPTHLGIGQEAVAVGVSATLRSTDRVFGAHRSHSHYLALGGEPYLLFAEVLGRVTGSSRGMGGSMHLFGPSHGFLGSVPIVGASVPIAVGTALAARMDGNGDIAVSYFGDGAVEEGAVQESLNLAATMQLPVLFVCENNLFASHMHIGLRQPDGSTVRFAQAHHIDYAVVDGNDVVAVTKIAREMAERARQGAGPAYLEAVTYRWRGHVGPREDTDVGVKRSEDLVQWKGRDPIRRLAVALELAGALSTDQFIALQNEIRQMITETWAKAELDPFPPSSALLDWVYFDERLPL
ncbi:MAG: thiamine pyrophosphate-dependent dehydrogenase E1 component subunit alpha [Anaerolineae bacterium]